MRVGRTRYRPISLNGIVRCGVSEGRGDVAVVDLQLDPEGWRTQCIISLAGRLWDWDGVVGL